MREDTIWVGLDTHKSSINAAVLRSGGEPPLQWRQGTSCGAVNKLKQKLSRLAEGQEIRCCYEAGPGGFWLKRKLEHNSDIVCEVIAPSLIPSKSGNRVKTDRRDAKKLVELFRAGLLTEVLPPTPAEEALRDLCRCRDAVRRSRQQARQRLAGFLLRQGRVYRQGRHWTQAHRRWLRKLSFEEPVHALVFEQYLALVELLDERFMAVEQELLALAEQEPYGELVGRLRCFHGVDTVSAITVVAEIYEIGRFNSARQLMSYLGLTPSESSSGERSRKGAITKAGNSHVRRVLVEASKHYRHYPRVGARLRKRRQGQPAGVVAIAEKAHHRLYRRHRRLTAAGKPPNVASVAVARELVGFIWAVMR